MNILKAVNLRKIYGQGETEVRALDGINLEVEKGEFVAIVGTSGSGKSTLLHIIGGLDNPTSGQVIADGQNLSHMTDEELIMRIHNDKNDHGDNNEIMDYILEKYKPLVRKKTNALYLIGGENDDLIQEGMIGLYKAIRDFRLDKQASFHAFAELCVNRQIITAIKTATSLSSRFSNLDKKVL